MRRNLFWLSDEQWKRIEPRLPTDVRGVERADDRRVISGIVHVLKSGSRWCDCPPEYGPSTTIYNRFVGWAERGIWENLFRELAGNGRSTVKQFLVKRLPECFGIVLGDITHPPRFGDLPRRFDLQQNSLNTVATPAASSI